VEKVVFLGFTETGVISCEHEELQMFFGLKAMINIYIFKKIKGIQGAPTGQLAGLTCWAEDQVKVTLLLCDL